MTKRGTEQSVRWLRPVIVVVVLGMVGAGCGGSEGESAKPRDVSTSTTPAKSNEALSVQLVDYGFESPGSVPAGYVDLQVSDRGSQQHEVQIGKLNDGVTWDQVEERLHGPAPDSVAQMVTLVGGTAPVEPGGTASTTVRLDEGQYGMFCFVIGWDGSSHLMHGMAKPLEVGPPRHDTPAPTAKGTIVLKDMTISLPAGFDGTGTWKVVNLGAQPHQATILQYADGATDADVDAYLTATTPPAKLPATAVGGAGAISPGQEEWVHLDLPTGKTLWVCMVPDTTKGMIPHVMEGMRTTFTKA